ncbi:hypothetical protein [Phenylobacterium sp.]|uniref:DUF7662 domain-containing protein n=1 Tax=Phenylobacterium sp. TaxID=1871053 RepID=UPI0035B24AA6
MSKYQPLADHLAAMSADEWRASFAEVESVLGFSLPKTASTHGTWWSNDDDKPHKAGWLSAGWRVADVDRREGKVVFERAVKTAARKPAAVKAVSAPAPVAVIPASPEGKAAGAVAPKTKLIALAAGTAALVVGLGVTAARLLRRR